MTESTTIKTAKPTGRISAHRGQGMLSTIFYNKNQKQDFWSSPISLIPLVIMTGIKDGKSALGLASAYIIGKIVYAIGKAKNMKSQITIPGGLMIAFSVYGLIYMSVKSSWGLIKDIFTF